MFRAMNKMGDRLLGLVVPRVSAAAADCGSPRTVYRCTSNGLYQRGACWTNSNCSCTWTTIARGC